MDDFIKNCELKNNTKRFNKKSLLISINHFLTPFIVIFICVKILNNSKYIENLIHSSFQNEIFNNDLVENKNSIMDFLTNILLFISTLITFLISIFLIRKRNDSISTEKTNFSLKKLIIFGILLGFFMILWNIIILQSYSLFGLESKSENTETILNSLKNSKILLINLLIFAPIGEEITFKYGIFTFFHELFNINGTFLKVILPSFISAFIFALMHDGLYLVPVYIVPSFIGCILYKKTRSLLPCIVGHFLNNLLAIIILLN